jgi:hypothetical protein
MKKTTLITKFKLLFISFMVSSSLLFAGNIDMNSDLTTKLKITENTYSLIEFSNTVSDLNFVEVKTRDGYFTLFNITDYGYSMDIGNPKLPVLKRLIEVPLNATFEIEVISESYQEFNLLDYGIDKNVFPAQPSLSKSDDPENVEFVYNEANYQVNGFIGQELIKVVELGTMRGVRMARIEISPIQYNPVQKIIKVYDNIKVRVNFVGGNTTATIQKKEELFSPYFEGIYSRFANYKAIDSKELITDEPVTFIIVSDPMFESALQPYIAWKIKKGFNVVEAYTDDPNVGNSSNSIKSYLEDFYNNPPAGYNPQSFVLFVGDNAQIPSFNTGHLADLYFCTYDGAGDIYPECYYGRFSANNVAELLPQIDKTLEYEQFLMPDPSFLDEVVMVAGEDSGHIMWSNGQINYGTTNYYNVAHGITSHTYLQPEPGGGNYSQNIRQNVSDGVAFGNYTAHCGPEGWGVPSFNNSHVPALQNAHKYPLLVGNCCSSNDFSYTCFGETLLRAVDKGAIGYIGGSASTYWDEDYWWGVGAEPVSENPVYVDDNIGAYDGAFHDHGEPLAAWFVTQGQMTQAGNLAVTQAGGNETYYWEIYHLMGDPSLMIYYSQPPDPVANYQALMPLGSTSFTVNTDPYSYVAISKDGVLCGCCIADETGLAEVNMMNPISVPGTADVVITGQNLKPFIGTVSVASPEGAYVLFNEFEIDDSNGNNDGKVDYNENILLDVTLENLGNQTGSNLSATISTTDNNITINNASHDWPNISAGGSATETGAFEFTVNELIEDQHVVQFNIDVTDGIDTWNSVFNVTLNAPVLEIGNFYVDDSYGNNNGRLDPGENADIIIVNINDGASDALDAIASAVTSSGLITINNSSYDLETIVAGETKNAVFNITVDESAEVGDEEEMEYTVEAGAYSANLTFLLNIGLIVEDFEAGNFDNYDWEFDGNADWLITDSEVYEGAYAAKSGTISNDQTSALIISVNVTSDDQISFFRKVSSEDNYDYLRFYIDGVKQGEWCDEVPWGEVSYSVTAGEHTFKWTYEKDISVSNGSDCGWIDYIIFPPFAGSLTPLSVTASANPSDICLGQSSQLNAFATGGVGSFSYEWNPTTGLSDPNLYNPVANPVETTVYTVTVSDDNSSISDEITITVNPVPATPVIVQDGENLTSDAENGNQWYNSNGAIPGATEQIYTPTETDNYYVIVSNEFGCESEMSNELYFIYTGIIEIKNGENVNIFPNPFNDGFSLDFSLSKDSNVNITIYNIFGQQVDVIVNNEKQHTGNHRIRFDASNLEHGVYFLHFETGEYKLVKRIIHSK